LHNGNEAPFLGASVIENTAWGHREVYCQLISPDKTQGRAQELSWLHEDRVRMQERSLPLLSASPEKSSSPDYDGIMLRDIAVGPNNLIDRDHIAGTYEVIRPHIRRTPVVEVPGSDFGLDGIRIALKLESLQHAGSFKARGAFANLLLREVPPAGVVAASGGNHGVAVAFCRHEAEEASQDLCS